MNTAGYRVTHHSNPFLEQQSQAHSFLSLCARTWLTRRSSDLNPNQPLWDEVEQMSVWIFTGSLSFHCKMSCWVCCTQFKGLVLNFYSYKILNIDFCTHLRNLVSFDLKLCYCEFWSFGPYDQHLHHDMSLSIPVFHFGSCVLSFCEGFH